jgi:dihydrofolate reductase
MRRVTVFNMVSLDGYFVDREGSMSWAHNPLKDEAWEAFSIGNASAGGLLIFGRLTYELMHSYWPTPAALQNDPIMAQQMNTLPKVVFSKTLDQATWNNTRLVKEDLVTEIRKMKAADGPDMAILGSGSIVAQLTPPRLIDEYQLVLIPGVLGKGRTLFDGLGEKLSLKLTQTRAFGNGNVLLCYEPLA